MEADNLVGGKRMPVVFFGHGSPTNVLEDNDATRTWADIARRIGKPRAILIVSAHWCTSGVRVTAMASPPTIHDFGRSLPAALFDQKYPAPGSVELAERVSELLAPEPVTLDHEWGLDHGTWSVLSKAYPDADVPVVQLSIDARQGEAWHHALAERLKPLRDEGILIAGSGNIVHNLGVLQWNDAAQPYPWAVRFNDYVKKQIIDDRPEGLFNVREINDDARLAVPSEDHYWPLLYVLGTRTKRDSIEFLSDYITFSSLGMTSLLLYEADEV
tara:strand:+ start:2960 stop:3775 length:816 start_codon:yes stop_codon:yes gene_type:complete